MQTVKTFAVRHAEDFTRDPVGKLFGTAIDLFFLAFALSVTIGVAKWAWHMVYSAAVG